MQNPIKHGIIATLLTTSIIAAAAPRAGAQDHPNQRQSVPVNYPITVNFPGGPLKDYVKAVQKAAGSNPVNIIYPIESAEIEFPALSLRDVTIQTALQSLRYAQLKEAATIEVNLVGAGGEYAPTFAIQFNTPLQQSGNGRPATQQQLGGKVAPPEEIQTDVLSVRDLVDPPIAETVKVSREQLLSAIDTAFQVRTKGDPQDVTPPEFLFHDDTGLLIIRGTKAQISTVRDMVSRFRDDLQQRRSITGQVKHNIAQQQRQVQLAQNRVELKKKEFEIIEKQYDDMRKRTDAGASSIAEFRAAELELLRKKMEVEEAVSNLNDAAEQFEHYKQDVAPSGSSQASTLERYAIQTNAQAAVLDELTHILNMIVEPANGVVAYDPAQMILAVKAPKPQQDLVAAIVSMLKKAGDAVAPDSKKKGAREGR